MHILWNHRRFVALLGLFIIGTLVHSAALPLMEGSDEIIHYTYVEHLRSERTLPDRTSPATHCTQQESGQPPLVYLAGALLLDLVRAPGVDCLAAMNYTVDVRNPWRNTPDPWVRDDNARVFTAVDEAFIAPPDGMTRNARVVRLVSVAFGALAVVGAYLASREVFQQEGWALLATAIFAFTPTLLHLSAYFNNDTAVIAFATLAVWQALRVLRLGANPRQLLTLGIFLALGALAKVSILLLGPAIGLALLLDWRRRRAPLLQLVRDALWVGGPMLALFGPWVLWGLITYADPFGFNTHTFGRATPRALTDVRLKEVVQLYYTYVGKFGFAKVYMRPLTYRLVSTALAIAAIGYLFTPWRRIGATRWRQIAVLATLGVVFLVGFFYWFQQLYFVTGRLLYPAHIVFALAVAGGFASLATTLPPLTAPVRAYGVGLFAVVGRVVSTTSVRAAFAPPLTHTLPPLEGRVIDYDGTLRFLGYTRDDLVVDRHGHDITLCWEVLQPATRRAAFSLKFIHDGEILADRTSLPGMGNYDASRWRAGDVFCDFVHVNINDPDLPDDQEAPRRPGLVYDMLLVLLDAETFEVDWATTTPEGEPIEVPVVGQVVSPAGEMTLTDAQPRDITYPNFATLAASQVNGPLAPSATIALDLLWEVQQPTDADLNVFMHLVGPTETVVLADGKPRGWQYPTWAWQPGDQLIDPWKFTLPEDLPPGEYRVLEGL